MAIISVRSILCSSARKRRGSRLLTSGASESDESAPPIRRGNDNRLDLAVQFFLEYFSEPMQVSRRDDTDDFDNVVGQIFREIVNFA